MDNPLRKGLIQIKVSEIANRVSNTGTHYRELILCLRKLTIRNVILFSEASWYNWSSNRKYIFPKQR